MYKEVIREFEDEINLKDYFKSYSFREAINKLKISRSNLKFLIGEAGVGKTFLLNYYYKEKDVIFLTGCVLKEELNSKIKKNKLIVIDEAQLLDEKIVEYIRTLADTKEYYFVLSMHTEDAKRYLNRAHFKSRYVDIIELKRITKQELEQFINHKLFKTNKNHLFSRGVFNTIYRYTKGNFRYSKKFVKTMFELLEFAYQNNLKKYDKINSCILIMSAIHLGLENG
jgi:hypothetical protein